ncbi:MAG: YjbH domain-containing protein [Bacteroides sp.]|nr:YjbH domain-containing protein [Bacteroides sp.]
MRRNLLSTVMLLITALLATPACAQLYTGLSGLINTPSADMNEEGNAWVGCYYMNKHFTPGDDGGTSFAYDGKKYNTTDFYLAITPFRWIELSYAFTLMKTKMSGYEEPKYNAKDRYFSIKLNLVREGRYHPAIAIGSNDFIGSPTKRHSDGGNATGYFCNYYLALTKHFKFAGHDIGMNLAYRYCPNEYNRQWEGVVGGLTWRPKWVPDLRIIAEYTGNEVNVGMDCLLWKHLFLQATLQEGKYFSGGICFQVNLF